MPTDNRISGGKLNIPSKATFEQPNKQPLFTVRPDKSAKIWFPFILGLVLILMAEVVIALPPVQKRLDALVINPLPTKLEEVKAIADTGKPMALALGTSRTYNGFSPQAFNKAYGDEIVSYNMGLPQSGYDVMLPYLKYHVENFGKPQIVFLETTDFLFDKHLTPSVYYYPTLFAKQPSLTWNVLTYPIFDMDERQNIALTSVSGLFRYRKALSPYMLPKVLLGKVGTGESDAANPVTKDGWQQLNESELLDTPDSLWITNKKYAPVDMRQLEMVIDYAQSNNIRVILVDYPDMTPYRELALKSSDYKAYDEAVSKIAQEKGIRHINFNEYPGADQKENYTDIRHLNPKHAEMFTRLLAEEAKKAI